MTVLLQLVQVSICARAAGSGTLGQVEFAQNRSSGYADWKKCGGPTHWFSNDRQFKMFYLGHACRHLRAEFPHLPSYSRVVELMPRCAVPLAALLGLLKGRWHQPVDWRFHPACGLRQPAYLLKHRSLVETVIDELKNLCQIEHTRHRSVANFLSNLMGGIIAYCLKPNKPRLPVHETFSNNGECLIPN